MEELICKNCKYFYDGECRNYYLTRAAKKRRMNESACEYWVEQDILSDKTISLKRKLLYISFQLEEIANSLKDDEK